MPTGLTYEKHTTLHDPSLESAFAYQSLFSTLFLSCASSATMRFNLLPALAVTSWIGAAVAHNIQLRAHSRECFHEELHTGDKMTVTFQVGDRENGGAGNLDIDFRVPTPPRS